MKKILIALSVALLLAVSCASPKAQSSALADILSTDISQTIINPDSLVVEWFEFDENVRVID